VCRTSKAFPGRLERKRKVSRGPAQGVVSEAKAHETRKELQTRKETDAFGEANAGSRHIVMRLCRTRAGKQRPAKQRLGLCKVSL
jgi:hypothetical protein